MGKKKVNSNLDWSILDMAKPYSPASKKCMSYLTEKYHIIFSINSLLNKRTELVNKCSILQILLCFNYFPKAILKDFLVNSVAVNNIFSNLLSSEDRYLKTASETMSNDIKRKF